MVLHKFSNSLGDTNRLQSDGIMPKINKLCVFIVIKQHNSLAGRKLHLQNLHQDNIKTGKKYSSWCQNLIDIA